MLVIVDPSDGEDNLRRVRSPCESYLSGSSVYREDVSVHVYKRIESGKIESGKYIRMYREKILRNKSQAKK